ncbi:hypothetical protein K438DRAFT_2104044 [Mycena galopus ATCC 62051]|nr:hypothetical protein K438DRAFT_2104044 [Mycena galopus ATCC 62051]
MSDDDSAPLTATENAALRALLARADTTPRPAGNGNGGVSVQTDNTAGEIDDFSSPTFKSLPMWFPRVRSAVLDLIIDGKFEAEDLIKLSSHGAGARERGRPLLWFPDAGYAGADPYPDESWESGVPRAFSKAFSSIVPLLGAWTTYTGIRALCDPTNGGVAAAFSIYTALLLQFSTQYEWSAVLHYHYEFTRIRLQENFRPTRWTIPDPSLMATCLIRYPLLPTPLPAPAKKRGLADRLSSPAPQTPAIRQKVNETCFNFNGADGCRMGDKCARNHVCISCSGPHTNQACPNRK